MKIRQFIIVGIMMMLVGCSYRPPGVLCWADDQITVDCRYSYYKDGNTSVRVFKPRRHCPKPIHCDDQYHYDDTYYHDGTSSFDTYHVKKGCGYCAGRANTNANYHYFP